MRPITALLLVLFLLPACSREAAMVGSLSISTRDIERRAAVSAVQYPGSDQPLSGLAQLIRGYLAIEVLRTLGRPLDIVALDAESERIDRNTKAPDLLDRIKAIYGNDRKSYVNTYVRVVLAERLLYGEVFPGLTEVQKDRKERADEFLRAALKSPADFIPLAQKAGFTTGRFHVSEKYGVIPYDAYMASKAKGNAFSHAESAQPAALIIAHMGKLRPGMVYPEIIEGQESYEVLRKERRESGGTVIIAVTIPKQSYDDWFWEQAKEIPVKVHDRQLKREFVSKVSWAKLVRLE